MSADHKNLNDMRSEYEVERIMIKSLSVIVMGVKNKAGGKRIDKLGELCRGMGGRRAACGLRDFMG